MLYNLFWTVHRTEAHLNNTHFVESLSLITLIAIDTYGTRWRWLPTPIPAQVFHSFVEFFDIASRAQRYLLWSKKGDVMTCFLDVRWCKPSILKRGIKFCQPTRPNDWKTEIYFLIYITTIFSFLWLQNWQVISTKADLQPSFPQINLVIINRSGL